MIDVILLLIVFALGVGIALAIGRVAGFGRDIESVRLRVAGVEMALTVALRQGTFQQPAPAPAPGPSHSVVRPAPVRPQKPAVAAESVTLPVPSVPLFAGLQSPHAEADDKEHESLETRIGSRWLLYIGIVAIVIGVAYFEKLAIDNQWLGETARVIQGGVVGLLMTYAGLRFVRAGCSVYGQMITGGGGAILYLSTYAAFNYYHLISQPIAFALMVAITALVAWLADRLQSQGLALFAVGGGFAAPFLVPGTTDAQIALFGYDAILIGGTMLLSRRRSWPALSVVSYLATLLTVAGWADAFYTPEKYLRTEIFLAIYCAMFLYIVRQIRKSEGLAARASAIALWTAPVAYYFASWWILQDHGTAFLVWLVALMLVGGVLSERVALAAGFTVWIAVTVPLLLWTVLHLEPAWFTPGLTTIAAIYAIALAAQLRQTLAPADGPGEFEADGIIWLHLNGLLMFAAAYFIVNVSHGAATGALAAAFGVWQFTLAAIVLKHQRDQALHFAALGFTLLSIAIALQFDGPAVTIGWAAEGAVAVALGLRERRDWLRGAGAVLFAIAFWQSMMLLSEDRAVSEAVLFNPHTASAAAIAAFSYVIAWLHYRDTELDASDRNLSIGVSLVIAQIVTLALLTSEIHAYWALREGHFARELMVSVTWGAYATALIVIGLRKRYAPIRYFAMVVFAATIFKVFALDMADLQRIYRVSSVVGLGVLLLVTSYLYTRAKRA
jgi:uncharacterized membrane protein